jgi:hypothetical protein
MYAMLKGMTPITVVSQGEGWLLSILLLVGGLGSSDVKRYTAPKVITKVIYLMSADNSEIGDQ